jgi:hypothetical protein
MTEKRRFVNEIKDYGIDVSEASYQDLEDESEVPE